jgi:hypothetical protein
MRADERRAYMTPGGDLPPDVAEQLEHLRWAEALVFVYPDLVVQPAGDAEGLAGPGVRAGRDLHLARGA